MPNPLFTQRHYRALAKFLEHNKPNPFYYSQAKFRARTKAWDLFTDSMVSMLTLDNEKFDRAKFERAIGRKYP